MGNTAPLESRLQRYLPPDLADAVALPTGADREMEAFAHLASTRYLLSTYLPRFLVQHVLTAQPATPWLHQISGSLLFADISGSTALAGRLATLGRQGTETVTQQLNQVFERLIGVVRQYGGDLVSFGGDALLVLFADERAGRTAARAALEMQQVMHDYVVAVPQIGTFAMHLHIGVESGPLAFVSVGQPHARYTTVLGATVNRLAHAEGLAGPGEVVVGPMLATELRGFGRTVALDEQFQRLESMRKPRTPHAPAPDHFPVTAPSVDAIPALLNDLDLISPYLPPVLLNRIVADPQQPQIEAELKPVTALFAQIAGLEAMADMLPPAAAAQALQQAISSAQGAIEQAGGVVNKLDLADQGIKLVAMFGAPVAYEDHAARAARAALDMTTRLDDTNTALAALLAEHGLPTHELRQRIGLNSGTVFAGNVGSDERKEYTVMGDAVNTAARVMSAAPWDTIWCSEGVATAISQRMICETRGDVALRGLPAPIALFAVCGEHATPQPEAPAAATPLVGRAAELDWLRGHFHAAVQGEGRAVRLVGEAGVGKTRLAHALIGEAHAAGVRVLHAACLSYTANTPYGAWSEWLKALCGIVSGESDQGKASKLAAHLAALGPGMSEWLPLLGDMLRLDIPENRLTRGLDSQMRQARRFELLEALLLHAASETPLLVLFEDLHWADSVSLDLWRTLATRLGNAPVLLLALHRPFDVLERESDGAATLALHELSSEESHAIAAAMSAASELPDTLLQKVVERAAGNPLFLIELLRAVIEQHRTLDDLPDNLSGLLLARIDELDDSSKSVLRVASVIGQKVPFGVLRSLQTTDTDTLIHQLLHLDQRQMTTLERTEPERVHAFRHALIQEVAYQSLLYARRRELHGRIGEYLERRHADDLDDYHGLLAHHFRLSDRRDKAITYLLRAGHAARAVYANDEAIQQYLWALEATASPADPRGWEARDGLAEVYATIGRYDDALAQYAAILAAPNLTPAALCLAHRKRGSVLAKQGQYDAALQDLEHARGIAEAVEEHISLLTMAQILADIALVHKRRGAYDRAIAVCEAGLAAIADDPDSTDDEKIDARLHSELGSIYGMRGDYERSRRHFMHSLELREAVDDLPGIIISHNNLGYLWQLQGEYGRALKHYRQGEELAERINLRDAMLHFRANAASALLSLGMYAAAEERCQEALAVAHDLQAQHQMAQIQNTLGVISFRRGDYDQAISACSAALESNRLVGDTHHEANSLIHLSAALTAAGNHEQALEAAQQSLQHAEALQSDMLLVEALIALAQAQIDYRMPSKAKQHALRAITIATHIGSNEDQAVALRLYGITLAANGEPFHSQFEESIALLLEANERFELGRTWAAFGMVLLQHDRDQAVKLLKEAETTFIALEAQGELQRLSGLLKRS